MSTTGLLGLAIQIPPFTQQESLLLLNCGSVSYTHPLMDFPPPRWVQVASEDHVCSSWDPHPWLRAKTFPWFMGSFVPGAGERQLFCLAGAKLQAGPCWWASCRQSDWPQFSARLSLMCKRGCRRFSNYWYIKAVWSWEINKHSLESNLPWNITGFNNLLQLFFLFTPIGRASICHVEYEYIQQNLAFI